MHALKRWSIGIFSKVDEVVAKVENHEALVTAAIRDLKSELVEAKVQMNRVKKDGERMAQEKEAALQNASLWKQRAAQTLNDDEKALRCLRRSKKEQQSYQTLAARCDSHQQVEARLWASIEELEKKLDALKEKRNVLKTRQTSADALKLAGSGARDFGDDVEEILARWESKIESSEFSYELPIDVDDPLASEFTTREEDDELRRELAALRSE
ncbi:MAG: PspA/IM30 family protein [Deltaproteobacteria bacterium]|nr:PspA/IM30 family protein [Deltaproteobacteria bacterium]